MRKGELTKSVIDRDFPHQVALPAEQCTGQHGDQHRDFCAGFALAPRHHTVRRDDRDYLIFCFADRAHADRFRERFSGESFDPKQRGRGRSWSRWLTVPA